MMMRSFSGKPSMIKNYCDLYENTHKLSTPPTNITIYACIKESLRTQFDALTSSWQMDRKRERESEWVTKSLILYKIIGIILRFFRSIKILRKFSSLSSPLSQSFSQNFMRKILCKGPIFIVDYECVNIKWVLLIVQLNKPLLCESSVVVGTTNDEKVA